jgi:hypothetical protein
MLTETLLRIPFSVIGRCSLVPNSHWLQRKCARINLSQAASGMILQNHRQLPVCIVIVQIAGLGSLKEVTTPAPTSFDSKLLDDMNGISSTSDIFFHDYNYVCAFVELSFRFGGCETFMFLLPMRVCSEWMPIVLWNSCSKPINRMCIELSLWSCTRYYMSTPRTGKNLGKV